MTLEVQITRKQGGFALEAAFSAGAGVTALFGRSGAGKTSILNAVAGLSRPDAGHVRLDGRRLFDAAQGINLPAHKRRIAAVFQDALLFPHLDVRDNLMFGARYAPPGATGATLEDVVDLLGLAQLLARMPANLSGGEKQRVAIGRALLSRPALLLMDEPLANLDAARRADILPFLEELRHAQPPVPILYVSHALEEVARLADDLVIVSEGRVVAAGPTLQMLSDPAIVPLIGARQAGAVVLARVLSHGEDGLTTLALSQARLHLPHVDAAPGTQLRLRVMAHDVILAREAPDGLSALNVIEVEVAEIHSGEGPGAIVGLQSGSDRFLARVTARAMDRMGLAPGMRCHAILKATSVAPGSIGGGGQILLEDL